MIKYINTARQMQNELAERKFNKEMIDQKLKKYWLERGVDWQVLQNISNSQKLENTKLVLLRNIQTPNLEVMIAFVFVDLLKRKTNLDIKLKLLSFPEDHFDLRNNCKKALIDSMVTNISGIDYSKFEGKSLAKIKINGKTLPELHTKIFQEIFPESIIGNTDLLKIFSVAMSGALIKGSNRELKRIGSCYVLNPDTEKNEQFFYDKNCSPTAFVSKEGKILANSDLIDLCQKGLVRPSAKWYYALFLSLFVNGDRILLETFDDSSEIVPMVTKASVMLKNEIGFAPLIIKMPVDIPNLSIGEKTPTENYQLWALNGCLNKKQLLFEGSAYKNAESNMRNCIPFDTSLYMIGMDIVNNF